MHPLTAFLYDLLRAGNQRFSILAIMADWIEENPGCGLDPVVPSRIRQYVQAVADQRNTQKARDESANFVTIYELIERVANLRQRELNASVADQ